MKKERTITVMEELKLPGVTPVTALARLHHEGEPAFLFESVEGEARLTRFTYLGVRPLETYRASRGVVHALHLPRIGAGISRMAASWGLPADAALPLAYLAAGIGGALIGSTFASVTKHLRRSFVALVVWALVFFVSLTTLALAVSAAYGHGLGVSMAPAILLASAAYAFVVSFQLPLRRRS